MLRILFVDDDEPSIEPAKKWVKDKIKDIDIKSCTIKESITVINQILPDMVINDLLEGLPSQEQTDGLETIRSIWKNWFCPVVIYSARPDLAKEFDHPFIKSVQKGKNSESKLETMINDLMPHAKALKEAEKHIRQQFSMALRDIAPYAFILYPDDELKRREIILRSGRRRLAAFMDEQSRIGSDLASWEQYIFPPISDQILLGDIIRDSMAAIEDPKSFRVVMTPSCDLALTEKQKPVNKVLVCHCCSVEQGLELINMKSMKKDKLKDRLPTTVLSQGYLGPVLALPGLKGILPSMMANLKHLELISFDEIGLTDKKYRRIVSLDSPFRELVAWAYMQVACRPGLPDRNLDKWCDEIIAEVMNEEKKK